MGKKNRRKRTVSVKLCSKEDNDGQLMKWTEEQLSLFPLDPKEDTAQTFSRLILFWTQGRRILFWIDTQRILRSQVSGISYEFFYLFNERVMSLLDCGNYAVVKIWQLTIRIFMYVHTFEDPLTKLNNLRESILYPENLPKHSDACFLQRTYFYVNSRVGMTMLVHTLRAAHLANALNEDIVYLFGGEHVKIKFVYTGHGSQTENEMHVNGTISLRTLIVLIMFKLKHALAEFKILHWDDAGCSKGELLLQYSGHKCLEQMEIKTNHVLHIIDANATAADKTSIEACRKANDTTKSVRRKSKKKRNQRSRCIGNQLGKACNQASGKIQSKSSARSLKKKSKQIQMDYSSNIDTDRLHHSKLLTHVFEEASQVFQERRQQLNDLATKKCQPKNRSSKQKTKDNAPEPVHTNVLDAGGRAGKTFFSVLIGHEDFLYRSSKTTKHTQLAPCNIDLHGCTRDEALQMLNSSFLVWMDDAMAQYPWTKPVNILCGGGCQVLADAVEEWIRDNRNVGKRFV